MPTFRLNGIHQLRRRFAVTFAALAFAVPVPTQGPKPVGLHRLVAAPNRAVVATQPIAGFKRMGVTRGERAFLIGADVAFAVVTFFTAVAYGVQHLAVAIGLGLVVALPVGVISALLFGG